MGMGTRADLLVSKKGTRPKPRSCKEAHPWPAKCSNMLLVPVPSATGHLERFGGRLAGPALGPTLSCILALYHLVQAAAAAKLPRLHTHSQTRHRVAQEPAGGAAGARERAPTQSKAARSREPACFKAWRTHTAQAQRIRMPGMALGPAGMVLGCKTWSKPIYRSTCRHRAQTQTAGTAAPRELNEAPAQGNRGQEGAGHGRQAEWRLSDLACRGLSMPCRPAPAQHSQHKHAAAQERRGSTGEEQRAAVR